MPKLLSAIIVSYNTKDLTIQALTSLLKEIKSSDLLKKKSEILVVDNHSQDGSIQAIKQFFHQAKFRDYQLIVNKKNLGFARANNQALKQAQGQYLLLLNSDTIVQPGAIDTLVKTFIQHPDQLATATTQDSDEMVDYLGILSPTLLNADGSLQPQGGSQISLRAIFNQMFFLDDLPVIGKYLPSTQQTGRSQQLNQQQLLDKQRQQTQLIYKAWVSGAAMMIRKAVIDQIGYLDKNIFMYGEDQEFCLRARNHHFDIAVHPHAEVVHLGSASSSSEQAIVGEFKSYQYIWQKHFPAYQQRLLRWILRAGARFRMLIYRLTGNQRQATIYREALAAIN
ncbi:MAG TPA: glycosyltransferase family 2 protein [Candidatus Woesebacteria bacterium]|nr:glycosyltransferase family 2 protein [Candidatus Woesebacteria bacterium]HPK08426.1 glycosyltransferase family 2 protein [Candidatus Woesebacteria bacterium]HQO51170.1 glycosyltransferase family 2 protein [Candidatus Woesebacteria bacterium]